MPANDWVLTTTTGNDVTLHGYPSNAGTIFPGHGTVTNMTGGPDLRLGPWGPDEEQVIVSREGWELRYPGILATVREMPWALRPEKLAVILDLLRFRAEGGRLSADEIRERIGSPKACDGCDTCDCDHVPFSAARATSRAVAGGIAVIPIFGTIVQRAGLLAQSSGAMGTEQIGQAFRQAVDDPNVGAIVLQMDSPGGGVYGVAELADTIYKARGSKPIVAVADSEAASAAYWIASAAEELVVTPSGMVGSIGVFTAHQDVSAMYEAAGMKVSLISAGKYKVEANPFEPLSDEARAAIQAEVDDYYAMFTKAVARGRGVGIDAVRAGFGQGRMVTAQKAVKLGMADRVETLDQVVARLSGARSARSAAGADDLDPAIAASEAEASPPELAERPDDAPPGVAPGATTGAGGADTDRRRRRFRLLSQ
jgi:signal peptide peptidase SppA